MFNLDKNILLASLMIMGINCYANYNQFLHYCVFKPINVTSDETYTFVSSNYHCVDMNGPPHTVTINLPKGTLNGVYCKDDGNINVRTAFNWDTCPTEPSYVKLDVSSDSYSGGTLTLVWDKGLIGSRSTIRISDMTGQVLGCKILPAKCHDVFNSTDGFYVDADEHLFFTYYPNGF